MLRPTEHGPNQTTDLKADDACDFDVTDPHELADGSVVRIRISGADDPPPARDTPGTARLSASTVRDW